MKKLIPWLLGLVIGMILSGAIGLILLVAGAFVAPDKILDNGYSIIAVSWGSPRGQTNPLIYQARVSVSDGDGDGVLDVRSIVYIGSGMYQHDMGVIGKATSYDDAVQRFGKISWTDSELLIAGTDGIKERLSRSSLESHR